MIWSHGTKSHMLVSKLCNGTSKTKAGPGGLVQVAVFLEVPLRNLFTSMCDFVPCGWIMQGVFFLQFIRKCYLVAFI